MKLISYALFAAPFSLALAASAHAGEIAGSAYYRERLALLPGATFEASLEDVSRPGAPVKVIGRFGPIEASAPPFRFVIRYDDDAMRGPPHFYSIRASVRARGRLLFTSTQATPPVPGGGEVRVLMMRAGGRGAR